MIQLFLNQGNQKGARYVDRRRRRAHVLETDRSIRSHVDSLPRSRASRVVKDHFRYSELLAR